MFSQNGSVELEKQVIKVEPGIRTQFVNEDQSRGCSNEPDVSQVVKTEPYYLGQNEELFSLADLAGRIQPSSWTPVCNEDEHSDLLNRNEDLAPDSDPVTKTF